MGVLNPSKCDYIQPGLAFSGLSSYSLFCLVTFSCLMPPPQPSFLVRFETYLLSSSPVRFSPQLVSYRLRRTVSLSVPDELFIGNPSRRDTQAWHAWQQRTDTLERTASCRLGMAATAQARAWSKDSNPDREGSSQPRDRGASIVEHWSTGGGIRAGEHPS
jgi:hypothetical protein